jgi:hypothetical protein
MELLEDSSYLVGDVIQAVVVMYTEMLAFNGVELLAECIEFSGLRWYSGDAHGESRGHAEHYDRGAYKNLVHVIRLMFRAVWRAAACRVRPPTAAHARRAFAT